MCRRCLQCSRTEEATRGRIDVGPNDSFRYFVALRVTLHLMCAGWGFSSSKCDVYSLQKVAVSRTEQTKLIAIDGDSSDAFGNTAHFQDDRRSLRRWE